MIRPEPRCDDAGTDAPVDHGLKPKRNPPSPTRQSYYAMRTRVTNPNIDRAAHYSGRGIDMDPRWDSFQCFLDDMGERPADTTLDRIDNNKGYWPWNCRWATPEQQAQNTRHNRYVVFNGKKMVITKALAAAGRGWGTFWPYKQKPENLTYQMAFDDMLQSIAARKRATENHCANGHPWTDSNLRVYAGRRQCITCHTELLRARKARRKSQQ